MMKRWGSKYSTDPELDFWKIWESRWMLVIDGGLWANFVASTILELYGNWIEIFETKASESFGDKLNNMKRVLADLHYFPSPSIFYCPSLITEELLFSAPRMRFIQAAIFFQSLQIRLANKSWNLKCGLLSGGDRLASQLFDCNYEQNWEKIPLCGESKVLWKKLFLRIYFPYFWSRLSKKNMNFCGFELGIFLGGKKKKKKKKQIFLSQTSCLPVPRMNMLNERELQLNSRL